MDFASELSNMRRDYSSRLQTCMKTLEHPDVGDAAKAFFYGESLYLQATLDRLEYLTRLYNKEHHTG